LGDVMKESAQAALSYVRAHARQIGAPLDFYEKNDVHIHVPAGAIPKDGPSAGITMTTALASLFSGRLVKPLLAMTGEVTLSGRVLPVGGVKEKVLGARRAGITTIVLAEKNRKDILEDLPDEVRENMRFEFVTDVSQVLELALESQAESQIRESETVNDSGGGQAASRSGAKKPRQTPKAQPLPGVVPNPSAIH
jgi:ATP-dependent Lon protease